MVSTAVILTMLAIIHQARARRAAMRWALGAASKADHESPIVLFVFRDAGESLALLPVLRKLRGGKGASAVAIVTGYGTAPTQILTEPGVTSIAALGVDAPSLTDRNATLGSAAVQHILAATVGQRPFVMVSGIVSAVQAQLASAALRQPRAHLVAGFDDSLSVADSVSEWSNVALRSGAIGEIWSLSTRITQLHAKHMLPWQRALTTGSPAFTDWTDQVGAYTAKYGAGALSKLRHQVYGTAAQPTVPVVLYYGGYGAGYAESVQTFGEGVAKLQGRASGERPIVAFSRHP